MVKKFLKRIVIMVLTFMICFLTGCAGDDVSNSDSTIEESFEGTWADINSQRCWLEIKNDGKNYSINVYWASTADESYHWIYSGTYDEKKQGIVCSGSQILEMCSESGIFVETTVYEDGESLFYIGSDGDLYWKDYKEDAGKDCVFQRDNSDESDTIQKVEFLEDWYRTYTYFESDSGDTLEISSYDDIAWFSAYKNGLDVFDGDGELYSKDSDGAYVYKADVGGGELRYYPNDGNYIILVVQGETVKYYPAEPSEIVTNQNKYVTDFVMSEDIGVYVRFAFTEKEYGNMYVYVLCDITNYSGQEFTLATDRYFTLNNNGVIKSGYCEYDYSRLANGATIATWIKFMYPEGANTNLASMTMNIDGMEVSLADKPQTEEEKAQLQGMYYLEGGGIKICIEKLSDGRYNLIQCMSYLGVSAYTFTLNEDGTFIYDGHSCTWNPETYSFTDHFAGQTYYKR